MKNITLGLLLVSMLLLISCGKEENEPAPITPDPEIEQQGSLQDFIDTNISAALSLFSDVNDCGDENVLISPLSLQTAAYMTMTGAAGQTLDEFRTAFSVGDFYSSGLNKYSAEVAEMLRPRGDNTSFKSSNAVFYSPSAYSPDPIFQEKLETDYSATFRDEDFSDPATVDVINDWVSEQTEQRIEEVIDAVDANEAILLFNALVFTADWKLGFPGLQDMPFSLRNGSEITVPTMYSDNYRNFTYQDDYLAIDLDVKDEDYSMTFILPNEGTHIDSFIQNFGKNKYSELYNNLVRSRIELFLPKFELSTHKNMKDILVRRGMETTFESADLRKMGQFAGGTNLSRVLHDAYVKIDEAGIEGAAVTSLGITLVSGPLPLPLNRPFIFIVRHVETNLPIFIGKMGNPSL